MMELTQEEEALIRLYRAADRQTQSELLTLAQLAIRAGEAAKRGRVR